MVLKNESPRTGAARGALQIDRLGRKITSGITQDAAIEQACRAIDDLISNGADLRYRPAAGPFPPSLLYEMPRGGDRQACRRILNEAKAKPLVWTALLRELSLREGRA